MRLRTTKAGHADVHEDDVGAQFASLFDGIAGIGGFTHHFEIGFAFQKAANALPEQRVIIH